MAKNRIRDNGEVKAEKPKAKKTECPITRDQFVESAQPVQATLNGGPVEVDVKEFSTGSLGWYFNGKAIVEVDGVKVKCQAAISLIIIGSKELPQE